MGASERKRKQNSVTVLTYKPMDTRFAVVSIVATLLATVGLVKFGAAPIAVLCVLLWLAVFFHHHPLLLMLLWPATLIHQQIFFGKSLSEVSSAFANLPILFYPMDVPYFFTIAYLIIKFATRRREVIRALRENPFLSVLMVIVLASLIVFTPLYGKSAIGEARKSFFCFLFPLLTALTIKTYRDIRILMLGVLITAVCLSLLGYSNVMFGRPIAVSGEGALVLLLTTFSILVMHANGMVMTTKVIDVALIGLFLLQLVITQQRSVALAGIAGLVLLFGLQRHKIPFLAKAIVTTTALLIVISLVFINTPEFERSFTKRMSGIIKPESDHTGSWRMRGWRQQLNDLSARELLVGKGLGSYYLWFDRGAKNIVGPHNTYVMIVLKLGLLGLVIYGLLVFRFFHKILGVANNLPRGPMRAYLEMSVVNFGAAHAYMMGYDFCLIILMFYAIGTSAARLLEDFREVSEQRKEAA